MGAGKPSDIDIMKMIQVKIGRVDPHIESCVVSVGVVWATPKSAVKSRPSYD